MFSFTFPFLLQKYIVKNLEDYIYGISIICRTDIWPHKNRSDILLAIEEFIALEIHVRNRSC